MNEDAQSAADRRGQIKRKIRDIMAILPVLGVVLFASPLVFSFTDDEPNTLGSAALAVFAIWGGLIVATFILSRLSKTEAKDE